MKMAFDSKQLKSKFSDPWFERKVSNIRVDVGRIYREQKDGDSSLKKLLEKNAFNDS